jgi:RND family efflux transporter MFP subunit
MHRTSLAFLLAALVGCAAPPAPPPPEPAIVTVALPIEKPVADYVDYTGRTDANSSVDIRARVSGYLAEIKFAVGQPVKAGAVLFVIDQRPYQAALEQAVAQVKLADANLKLAVTEVKRNEPLVKNGATTQSEFDKLVAARDVSVATVEAAKAFQDNAQLNLDFCTVKSPISGRVSRNYLDVGNLVTADSTLLTTVVSEDPMYLYFDIDERTVLRIKEMIRAGTFRSAREYTDVTVQVGLNNEAGYPHTARVDFVDNKLSPSTGTIRIRAVVPNPELEGKGTGKDRIFSAGLFVRIRLPLGEPHKALLITERAIFSDQDKKYVYVVNAQDEVESRLVKLGLLQDGMREIVDGLQPGERVIVNGLQRVRPGAKVNPKSGSQESGVRGQGTGNVG